MQREGCTNTGSNKMNLFPSPSYSREFNIVLASVMLTVACYNGASFYIDVFSQRYHKEVVEKQKKTWLWTVHVDTLPHVHVKDLPE